MGKKIDFIIVFSIGLIMQDLLYLGMPLVEKENRLIIVFVISLCLQNLLSLGVPHVGKNRGFLYCFLNQSVLAEPFESGCAPCWKEQGLSVLFS